jgi:hypothetical protein
VELYFTVADQGGQETRFPDTALAISFPLLSGPLYINEFAASNKSVKKDEFGEYDDWVEVYNTTGQQVWLADYFLSDNTGTPGKYRFPAHYIEPGGFYLVWLDDQVDQGLNHATFKISKDGEKLRLSGRPSSGFQLIDSVNFGPQETDISLGRQADGGPVWIPFPSPTPNFSNLRTSVHEYPAVAEPLSVYPNPVGAELLHFNKRVTGTIYNIMGQKLMQVENAEEAPVTALKEGFYIFRSQDNESVQFIVTR